jgi:hypothetical protein
MTSLGNLSLARPGLVGQSKDNGAEDGISVINITSRPMTAEYSL